MFLGFPCGSAGKESTCNAGDPGSVPGSGRSPGEGIGYPLQCSWTFLVAQLVKNPLVMWETWIWSLGREELPEKEKATQYRVFWPGEFHGLYSPRDHKESEMTEQLSLFNCFSCEWNQLFFSWNIIFSWKNNWQPVVNLISVFSRRDLENEQSKLISSQKISEKQKSESWK